MTKTLYYVNTNGGDFMLTDDGETRRVIDNEYAYCPRNDDGEYIDMERFLAAVEDDSSWREYTETVEELTAGCTIVAQVERNDI